MQHLHQDKVDTVVDDILMVRKGDHARLEDAKATCEHLRPGLKLKITIDAVNLKDVCIAVGVLRE